MRVPLRRNANKKLDLPSLQGWGCIVQEKFAGRISKQSIESQLAEPESTTITVGSGTLDSFSGVDGFINKLNVQLKKSPGNELLIFVHGCCEGPQDSLDEAAQLSVYCNCPLLLFDWASPSVRQAGVWSYIQSDRALEFSELYFGKLIEHLKEKASGEHITLVAYSMGSKLVRNYLRQFPNCFIDQVHLVRPDISLPVFLIEQDKFKEQFGKMYIYVSEHDLALQSSAVLMSSQVERLGMQQDCARWFIKQLNNAPANTIIIDTADLKQGYDPIGHRIPFEAIGFVDNLAKAKFNSSFEIEKPFTMNPNFWHLKVNNH